MKKMLLTAAGLALSAVFALSGCASSGQMLPVPPQQLITDFCPVVNADLNVLAGSPLLTAQQQATVKTIETANQAVCTAGAAVNLTDLQTLNATAFPALVALVTSIPGLPNQPAILLGLTLAQPILAQVVQSVAAQHATAASAPAAASTPLAGVPLQ